MKIGIISINTHAKVLNFASPLHTYAFQQFLLNTGSYPALFAAELKGKP